MRLHRNRWLKTFFILTLIFSFSFVATAALGGAFLVPLLGWIFVDGWQWTPFNRWLRFVVLSAIVGVIAGAFFTTHAWLTETRSSMLRRIFTTAAVVITCIAVVVYAREYLGRVLPG